MLHWSAGWRDVMVCDAEGGLAAIDRHQGDSVTRIDPAKPPAYRVTGPDRRPRLVV